MYNSNTFRIAGTGSYTPDRVVTNAELAQRVATDPLWIEENLGIRERRIAAPAEYTSDLAYRAGMKALESANTDRNDLDLIIVATATPDRKAPSTACLTKNKLGISNLCPAIDLAAVCSGFVYALNLASVLIDTGTHRKILIIGADTFSKITDWSSRDCVFFGDGAGAVVVEKSAYKNALFSGESFSDTREPDHFTVYPTNPHFTMNGRAVYETGSKVLPDAIRHILSMNALTVADIGCIIPHQPSQRLLRRMAESLDIPFAKVRTNMDRFANTSAATVPLLLDETNRNGDLKRDDLVVFAAVGSGWTWGAALYRWH